MSGCCGIDTENGASPGGGSASFGVTAYEVDFAAQPAAVMVPGINTIAGEDWTYVERAGDVTALDGATGLTYASGALTSVWTSSSFTASNLSLPMSTLYGLLDCDMRAVLQVEVYFSSFVCPTNSYMGVSFYGESGSPTGASSRQMSSIVNFGGGVDIWKASSLTSFGPNYQYLASAWGLISYGNGFANAFAGQYAGAWPDRYAVHMNAQMSGFNGVRHPEARTAIYWANGNTLGTTVATVERIRFTAYQPRAA